MTSLRAIGLAAFLAVAAVSCMTQSPPRPRGWEADPTLLAKLEEKKAAYIFREKDVPPYTLPEALLAGDGTRITTQHAWEAKRRPETLALFEKHVYGRQPAPPEKVAFEVYQTDPTAMDGQATLKRVKITSEAAGKSFTFNADLLVPNHRSRPAPAFLLINIVTPAVADATRQKKSPYWPAEDIIARGFATAVFFVSDVDPDKDGDEARAAGIRAVIKGPGTPGKDAWATLGAWAWGASRVLDYLETEPAVDARRVAVIGHSRGGKTALWAGATDPRFALVISNNSGCGGAALSKRCFGETLAAINKMFPYWFCGNFHAYDGRENNLPIDQHQLIALIAPRLVYVASATEDLWADPRGEFLSLAAASEVYALYGNPRIGPQEMPPADTPLVRGRMAYHIRTGPHKLLEYDWSRYMDFADMHWKK